MVVQKKVLESKQIYVAMSSRTEVYKKSFSIYFHTKHSRKKHLHIESNALIASLQLSKTLYL